MTNTQFIVQFGIGLFVVILLIILIYRIVKLLTDQNKTSSNNGNNERVSGVACVEADTAEIDPNKIFGSTKELSKSIVSIINNMDSKGHLSVCLNGIWGSGKSTLINLTIPNLREKNCTCVFFNAWHHESEHHLYVALIDQIRKSWIPRSKMTYPDIEPIEKKTFRERCINFQIRLLDLILIYLYIWKQRVVRTHVQFVLFVSIVLVSFVSFWYLFLGGTSYLFNLKFEIFDLFDSNNLNSHNSHMYFTLLLISFTSWIFFWYSPYNTLKSFAAAPVSQVSARTPWLTFFQFAEQLSFRYRFAVSFNEVCDALISRNRRLVIIIDDIDRCSTDQILEIFEAVNFLCTNGPCFVLLAMDKDRVIKMLGKKNNNEHYFRKFLEKIINLTVNVRTLTA